MSTVSFVAPLPSPHTHSFLSLVLVVVVVEGEWAVSVMVWKAGGSQPDQRRHICSLRYHHLVCFRPPLPRTKTNKTKISATVWFFLPPPPKTFYLTEGGGWGCVTASTSAHSSCSHTIAHCGQSLCPGRVFGFVLFFFPFLSFFSFFWDFLLLLLGRGSSFFSFFK